MGEIPIISVVIPVYNAERYLARCLESVLEQTFSAFELLIIDDGSVDNSYAICKYYSQADNRIKLLSIENSGVSIARNIGIENSSGTYISFIDADDWIDKDYLEKLYTNLSNTQADISYCNYYYFFESRNKFKKAKKINPPQSNPTAVINYLLLIDTIIPIWTCLISKKIIVENGIRFSTNTSYGEDQEFILKIMFHCQTAQYLPDELYYYRLNEFSAISKKTLKQFDFPLAMVRLKNYFLQKKAEESIILNMEEIKIPSSINFVLRATANSREIFKPIIETINANNLDEYIKLDIRRNLDKKNYWIFLWNINCFIYLYLILIYKNLKSLLFRLINNLSK